MRSMGSLMRNGIADHFGARVRYQVPFGLELAGNAAAADGAAVLAGRHLSVGSA